MYICVQDVVELVAGLTVCVKATERGGRSKTCWLWLDVDAGAGVCIDDVPW